MAPFLLLGLLPLLLLVCKKKASYETTASKVENTRVGLEDWRQDVTGQHHGRPETPIGTERRAGQRSHERIVRDAIGREWEQSEGGEGQEQEESEEDEEDATGAAAGRQDKMQPRKSETAQAQEIRRCLVPNEGDYKTWNDKMMARIDFSKSIRQGEYK